jgi:uncharacterized protein YndB with AHSA1/START domain
MTTIAITPDQDSIVAEAFIAAPPERVFQAMTDPAQLMRWWGQKGRYQHSGCEMDVRVGGKWMSTGTGVDGTPYKVEGEYLEVDPPHALTYTWKPSFQNFDESTVSWRLEPADGGTLLKLRHFGLSAQEKARKDYAGGWPTVLSWLRGYLERGEVVDTRETFSPPAH